MVGNFPQAFSHVGLINTARNLARRGGPAEDRRDETGRYTSEGDRPAPFDGVIRVLFHEGCVHASCARRVVALIGDYVLRSASGRQPRPPDSPFRRILSTWYTHIPVDQDQVRPFVGTNPERAEKSPCPELSATETRLSSAALRKNEAIPNRAPRRNRTKHFNLQGAFQAEAAPSGYSDRLVLVIVCQCAALRPGMATVCFGPPLAPPCCEETSVTDSLRSKFKGQDDALTAVSFDGHDDRIARSSARLWLQCDHCGRETAGWQLGARDLARRGFERRLSLA